VLLLTWLLLPNDMGKTKQKAKFSQLFSNSAAINWLSAARFFLFGSRDVWFVIALPVYFSTTLGWSHAETGSFFALWIIGYGIVQGFTPQLLANHQPSGNTTQWLAWLLMLTPLSLACALYLGYDSSLLIIIGLSLFAIVFAVNSAVHSYLIVEWAEHDKVSMNVGFYYMANAGGRLVGTILSGLVFQFYGLIGCLITAALFIASAAIISRRLD
jgi:hypothetical protein